MGQGIHALGEKSLFKQFFFCVGINIFKKTFLLLKPQLCNQNLFPPDVKGTSLKGLAFATVSFVPEQKIKISREMVI